MFHGRFLLRYAATGTRSVVRSQAVAPGVSFQAGKCYAA